MRKTHPKTAVAARVAGLFVFAVLAACLPGPGPVATTAPAPTVQPATPTAQPAPAPTVSSTATFTPTVSAVQARGHLVFTRAEQVILLNLADNSETALSISGSAWHWSRDGTRAVFVRGLGPASEIWTVNRDGSVERRLTNDGVSDGSPRWSPDGNLILYEHNVQFAPAHPTLKIRAEVWLMNADGSGQRRLADGFDPAWSPEGLRIAFASNPQTVRGDPAQWFSYASNGIHLINSQGRNEWAPINTNSPSSKYTPLEWEMRAARLLDMPVWSPDGKEITLRVNNGHGTYITTDPAAGGFGKFLALFFDDIARGFSYSPDGNYITVSTGGLTGWETVGIFPRDAIDRDGVRAPAFRTLGRPGPGAVSVSGFAWSPDSGHIAYALFSYPNDDPGQPPASAGIWIMDVTGGVSRQVITAGEGPLFWLP